MKLDSQRDLYHGSNNDEDSKNYIYQGYDAALAHIKSLTKTYPRIEANLERETGNAMNIQPYSPPEYLNLAPTEYPE